MLYTTSPSQSPWLRLATLFGFVLLGAFVGNLIGTRLVATDAKGINTSTLLSAPGSILALQAVTASSTFIIAPLFYWRFFGNEDTPLRFSWRSGYAVPLLWTLGLVLAYMITNTWFIHWNMTVKLPTWLHAFEVWAQAQEAAIQRISHQLTAFHSVRDLGIGIVVMAIIPAVGEELLFRGLIQPLCHQITRNIHSAIIISALAFSAIHLQFYGFVPRFLLGALFGYIYWWTKGLVFPIAAHFFNNALTLILLFLHQQGYIALDITKPVVLPIALLPLAILLVAILSHYLKHFSKKSHL